MQRVIWAILAAFAIAMVIGPFVLTWLKKLKFGQTILDIGPSWHKSKQGTPNMGGIMFAIGIITAVIICITVICLSRTILLCHKTHPFFIEYQFLSLLNLVFTIAITSELFSSIKAAYSSLNCTAYSPDAAFIL